MNNVYQLTTEAQADLNGRIYNFRPAVQLSPDEIKGVRYKDNSYIIFKIKQKWVTESGKSAQEFYDSLTSDQKDEYVIWGIKDAASADAWYAEKSRRDGVEASESNFDFRNRIILASREIEIFIKKTNEVLDGILKQLEASPSIPAKILDNAMRNMELLTYSIRQLQSRQEFRHFLPDEIEEKMEKINRILTYRSLGDDINEWYALITDGINNFISQFNSTEIQQEIEANVTDKLEVRKSILRYTRAIDSAVEDYQKKFGSTFDPSWIEKYHSKKNELAKSLGLYLEDNEKPSNKPLEIKTIDPDQLLDMYEEIKSMPEGEAKQEKIKEFEKLNRTLKSSYTNRISIRD